MTQSNYSNLINKWRHTIGQRLCAFYTINFHCFRHDAYLLLEWTMNGIYLPSRCLFACKPEGHRWSSIQYTHLHHYHPPFNIYVACPKRNSPTRVACCLLCPIRLIIGKYFYFLGTHAPRKDAMWVSYKSISTIESPRNRPISFSLRIHSSKMSFSTKWGPYQPILKYSWIWCEFKPLNLKPN